MRIDTFLLPPIGTNAFLITDPERQEAVLIDAPADAWATVAPVLDKVPAKLVAALLTHGHFDHIMGAAELQSHGVPLYAHPDDEKMIARLHEQLAMFGVPAGGAPPRIDHWLAPGTPLTLLGREIEIRHTPGHCPGNVTFYFPEENAAFVGDAIFAGGIGRTDLPGGNFNLLEQSIREQIYTLPENTTLYPGHGPATTVAEEAEQNPFVRR